MNETPTHNHLPKPETPASTNQFQLMDAPKEILTDLISEINNAESGERVWLRTLDMYAGEVTGALESPLVGAARRGADVRVIYDPITRYLTDGLPSFVRHLPYPNRRKIARSYQTTQDLLVRMGRNIQILQSRPDSRKRQLFPFAGADHIKLWIIGQVAYLGDKNLEDVAFIRRHGFVIKITNPDLVEALAQIAVVTEPQKKDRIILVESARSEILYDAGNRGESIIYQRALSMIKNQKQGSSIQMAMTFFPSGKILDELDAAFARGVEIQIITSRPDTFKNSPAVYAMNRLAAKSVRMQKSPLGFRFAPPHGVHAKYILTPDAVLFGSNNFVESGIKAGTAELDLYSIDPNLMAHVRAYHGRLSEACEKGQRMYPPSLTNAYSPRLDEYDSN